ncbi:hypothetical protein F5878DRAFT_654016 [Lentinula raphanica]|uniref:Uncharacterized protein n=1 Tax=Lentinula raphanica TaxID=153919 RepID=A0AA38P177_9AGAR|nr:hypothetical protein F5878DRAFT_654016 [Lentinula raphanica]
MTTINEKWMETCGRTTAAFPESWSFERKSIYSMSTAVKNLQHFNTITFPYPCIRIFEFTRSKLGRLPAYPRLLKLGKERKDACYPLGNDVRKAIQDGFPLWLQTFAEVRDCDILHPGFLMPVVPFTKETLPTTSIPSLSALHGHVSAIFTGAFFHLFNEEQQELIVRTLAGLLSPEPGSLVLGVQGGINVLLFAGELEGIMLWEGIFGKGSVEVEARVRREVGGGSFFDMYPGNKDPYHVLERSVTRL